jgi:hypothetical protein
VVAKVVTTYVGVYVKAFQLSVAVVRKVWDLIRDGIAAAVGRIRDLVSDLKGRLAKVWDSIRSKASGVFDALTAPIQAIIDLVDSLLDKIRSIHVPHVDFTPWNRSGTATSSSSSSGAAPVVITLNYTAAPGGTATSSTTDAQRMMDAIDQRLRTVGRRPVFSR